jgi:hypothetical protein
MINMAAMKCRIKNLPAIRDRTDTGCHHLVSIRAGNALFTSVMPQWNRANIKVPEVPAAQH